MDNANVFNPLDKKNLGKSVVDALLESKECDLASVENFDGAGIYAVYYRGNFASYSVLAALNKKGGKYPIYVGKAIPKGGRKGMDTHASQDSDALYKRLLDHRKSIESAESLKITDFSYRCLILDDIWISLGEALVIQKYQPLWNQVIEGFGNHDPGKGRHNGMRPLWDEIHPGRSWAAKCKPAKVNAAGLADLIQAYMQTTLHAGR
jgi:hypothetical protein